MSRQQRLRKDTASPTTKQVGKVPKSSMRIGNRISKAGKDFGDRISSLGSTKDSRETFGKNRSQSGLQSLRENGLRLQSSTAEISTTTTASTASIDEAVVEQEGTRPAACIMMDEGDFTPATIYTRVSLENDSHPFFKRTWTLRHRLDITSPLLDRSAYGIIEKFHGNGGVGWPPELNSYQKLRESVKFVDISVTMAGTDHVTGNVVFGNTSYTSMDLVIGYRFANTLVKNEATGDIGIDLSLLNDVLEQHGGGAEPLDEEAELYPPLTMLDIASDIENQVVGSETECFDEH